MHFNGSCWSTAGKNGKHHINTKTASRKHIALLIRLRSVITVHLMILWSDRQQLGGFNYTNKKREMRNEFFIIKINMISGLIENIGYI